MKRARIGRTITMRRRSSTRKTKHVSRPYPYPYGFVVGTNASDGCNLDVFIVTNRALRTGELVECEVLALMEQFEDGVDDHNVLAKLPERPSISQTMWRLFSRISF